jgi:transcriptional regulator with XRE-family HTH domain
VEFGGPKAFRAGRYRLAAELRRIRETAGLTTRELAGRLGVSQPWITHLETGRSRVPPEFASRWAQACGLGADQAAQLAERAEHAQDDVTNWRRALAEIPEGLAGIQRQFAAIERVARVQKVYQPAIIPGLLQTAEYMRHIFVGAEGEPEPAVAAAVAARLERQAILFEADRHFYFLVGEAALWARPGTPEAHRAQLDRVRQVAGLATVDLRILPLTAAPPDWHTPGFIVYEGLGEGTDSYIHVGLLHANVSPSEPDAVARYQATFDRIWAAAAGGAEAARLIAKAEASVP